MKKIYISPYTLVVILLFKFFFKNNECAIVFIIAIIHESAHLATASCLGYKIAKFKILPYGACLELENTFENSNDELIVTSAGPVSNLLMLVLCTLIKHNFAVDTSSYAYANIYMMIINMIPVFPLDGGRIFRCVFGDDINSEYTTILSLVTSFFVLALGMFLFIKTKSNFSLFCAGFFMINSTKVSENKSRKICDFIYNNKNVYSPAFVVINENIMLYECIKHIKMDRFIIIYLINNDNEIVNFITNIQIMKYASEEKCNRSLKDILIVETENNDG